MSLEQKSCPYCNFGIMRKTVVSMELMPPDGPVLVPDIHCEECDYCGNKSFDKKATQYIDRVINKDNFPASLPSHNRNQHHK